MYAVKKAWSKQGSIVECKHLIQAFKTFANQIYVVALCGESFTAPEITMFGDADLCEKCSEICKNLPRYVR